MAKKKNEIKEEIQEEIKPDLIKIKFIKPFNGNLNNYSILIGKELGTLEVPVHVAEWVKKFGVIE